MWAVHDINIILNSYGHITLLAVPCRHYIRQQMTQISTCLFFNVQSYDNFSLIAIKVFMKCNFFVKKIELFKQRSVFVECPDYLVYWKNTHISWMMAYSDWHIIYIMIFMDSFHDKNQINKKSNCIATYFIFTKSRCPLWRLYPIRKSVLTNEDCFTL